MIVALRNTENLSRASRVEGQAAIVVELEAGGFRFSACEVDQRLCLAWLKAKGRQVGRHARNTTAISEARALRSSAEERAAQK